LYNSHSSTHILFTTLAAGGGGGADEKGLMAADGQIKFVVLGSACCS
jgi:hypothetical protein